MNNEDKSLNISVVIKDLLIKDVMAYVLDTARMSNMGDRQFNQFEKSVKDRMYEVVRLVNDNLVEYDEFYTEDTSIILPKFSKENR